MSNIIITETGTIELTDREMKLYMDLVRFSAAYGHNEDSARYWWNAIVSEHGTAMVDYLKAISIPARECNRQWGTEGHLDRLHAVDAVLQASIRDIIVWAKPLF